MPPAERDPASQTAAASPPVAGSSDAMALIRSALAGAGTSVWDGYIDSDSDSLGDVDDSLLQLGYPVPVDGSTTRIAKSDGRR